MNSFVGNTQAQAGDYGVGNRWDDGAFGNYWSDYTGSDADGDGIGDVPYDIPPNGQDHRPLMVPP